MKKVRYIIAGSVIAILMLIVVFVLFVKVDFSKRNNVDSTVEVNNLSEANTGIEKTEKQNKNIDVKKNLVESRADFYYLPPTKYIRLTGLEYPSGLKLLEKFQIRLTPGEYEPLAFLIYAKSNLENIKITWNTFTGQNGNIPQTAMDAFIAKVWYQAGIKTVGTKNKILTQELLIKNDKLIKADYKTETNYLLITDSDGNEKYINISSPDAVFPENVAIIDSDNLLPFSVEKNMNKILWLTLHIPDNTKAGRYFGEIVISDNESELKKIPVEIEVLPFKLDSPRLTYAIYYHGYYDNVSNRAFHFSNKTEKLYIAELKDLKEHGIQYPTTYQVLKNIDNDLRIRNELGFPKDKLFSLGIQTENPQNLSELLKLKGRTDEWKNKIAKYGYETLYVYGIDEAKGELLKSQRPAWKGVHEKNAKVFVAGYYDTFYDMGDLLDIAVIQGELKKEQADLYHSKGKRIFSYSNPPSGEENPEIYRRNFGLALWKAGYDGAMEYAYQKNYGSTWNDFDHHKYRDMNFVYPTSNGIISTIQWEGFREGIDDVKYLSTLLNTLDKLKKDGRDVTDLEKWVQSLNPNEEPDDLRNKIIDKILSLMK